MIKPLFYCRGVFQELDLDHAAKRSHRRPGLRRRCQVCQKYGEYSAQPSRPQRGTLVAGESPRLSPASGELLRDRQGAVRIDDFESAASNFELALKKDAQREAHFFSRNLGQAGRLGKKPAILMPPWRMV